MTAVECVDKGHPPCVRANAIDDLTGATLASCAESALDPTVHLVTDGLAGFTVAGAHVQAHGTITFSPRKSSDPEPFRWVNTFIANCKTAIGGTLHHFELRKYRHFYIVEAQHRFNRRPGLRSLVGHLVNACACTQPCPEQWLRLTEARPG
jgi:hypothetical protein